ncbi:hypothetical protein VTO73DRAFT_12976 [Trametes versicolor]
MDALQDYYESLGRPGVLLESKRTWESQQALCACSLTCRAWHVRAQHLLWTLPHVLESQHLAQFTSAVRNLSNTSTAGLVLGDQRAYAIKTFDPSMVSALFMHSFDHLRHLLFYGFFFHRGPPLAILRMRLPFFASITVLQLLDCAFQSLRALLDVVWACPSLVTLAISRTGIKSKRISAGGLRLLSATVENLRACRKLTSLYLDAFTVQGVWDRACAGLCGGGSVFGCAVTALHFETDNISGTWGVVLGIVLWDSFPALCSVTVVSRVDPVFGKSSSRVLSVLHAIAKGRPIRGILKTIVLERDHEWRNSDCCEEIVGASEEVPESEQRLPALLAGLVELTVRLDTCKDPETHAAYVWSVLPGMRNVLRFEYRLDRDDDWTPYMLPVTE